MFVAYAPPTTASLFYYSNTSAPASARPFITKPPSVGSVAEVMTYFRGQSIFRMRVPCGGGGCCLGQLKTCYGLAKFFVCYQNICCLGQLKTCHGLAKFFVCYQNICCLGQLKTCHGLAKFFVCCQSICCLGQLKTCYGLAKFFVC